MLGTREARFRVQVTAFHGHQVLEEVTGGTLFTVLKWYLVLWPLHQHSFFGAACTFIDNVSVARLAKQRGRA